MGTDRQTVGGHTDGHRDMYAVRYRDIEEIRKERGRQTETTGIRRTRDRKGDAAEIRRPTTMHAIFSIHGEAKSMVR